jgi:uncharacterized sporulation protein YeaH/YhbH (DUF444 family)
MEFSDGDNWGEDNNLCVSYIRKMLPKCAMVGYGEVLLDDNVSSWTSRNLLSSIIERDVKEEKMVVVKINNEEEVFESLKKFFKVRP